MQTDEIGEALIKYFERVERGRCKTCQSRSDLATLIEKSDCPPGLGLMYLNWFKGDNE